MRLQLYLCHPFTQKGEITLHISEELGLIGSLGTVMFAVLEMHRDRAGKVDFLQVPKERLEINHALAKRAEIGFPLVALFRPGKVFECQHLNARSRSQQAKPAPPPAQAPFDGCVGHVEI